MSIKKVIKYIFAEDEDLSLENRLFLSSIIIGLLTSVVGSITNLILITSVTAVTIPFILSVLLSILYYFARFKKVINPFIMPSIVVSMIGISIIWIFNGGINGSNTMPGFIILILGLIVFPGKLKKYVLFLFLALNTSIYLIQFNRPDLIVNFQSETERWIDSLFTLFYVSYFIYLIINFVHKQYTSERIKSEESEKKYRELVENSPDAIIIHAKGEIVYTNKECLRLMAASETSELIGKSFIQFVHPDCRDLVIDQMKKVITEGVVLPLTEEKFLRLDGSQVDVEVKAMHIRLENTPAVQLIVRDITERKRAEEDLLQEQLFSKSLLDSLPGIFYLYTYPDMRLVRWNKNHETLLGFDAEELKGFQVEAWPNQEIKETVIEAMREVMENGQASIETSLFKKDGSTMPFILTGVRMEVHGQKYIMGVGTDISDRKIAEEALKYEQYLMHSLMENIPDHIYFKDAESRFIRISNAQAHSFGLSDPAEAVGKTDYDFFMYEHAQQAFNDEQEIMRTGQTLIKEEKETWIGKPDTWVASTKLPLRGKDAKILGTFGVSVDITRHKRAEEELTRQKYFFEQMFMQSSVSTQILDSDGWCERINPKLSEIFGVEAQDIEGSVYNIFHDEEVKRSGIIPHLESVFNEGKTSEWEVFFDIGTAAESQSIKVKEKKKVWYHNWAYPIFDRNKKITNVIIQHNNITEYKKAQDEILKSKFRYDIAMQATKDGLYDWDLITNGIYFSPGWKKMLGYGENEIANDFSEWERHTEPDDLKKTMAILNEVIDSKHTHFELEFRMKHKLGQWVEILSRANVLFNENGKAIRVVGTHVDITERKHAEKELIMAKEKAEESDRLKSAFLANMSHEIRTPMNGILGFAELLKEPHLSGEQQQEYVRIIKKSGDRMLNIINDIIDISKIESGQMKVHFSETDINEQVKNINTSFNPEAENKGIKLTLKSNLPVIYAIIQTDKEKLYAILTHLVKNAIKYTNEGTIEFGYVRKEKYLEFYVKDSGIGVVKERQEAIFERFIQADIFDSQAKQGAGLGLSITKAYVEMLGGTIWIESEVGQGSAFYFTIPYNTHPEQVNSIRISA